MKTIFILNYKPGRTLAYLVLAGVALAILPGCRGGGGSSGPTTPHVVSVTPVNGASSVVKNASITATFSTGFDDLVTQIPAEFTLGDSLGNLVDGAATYDAMTNIATFTPAKNLGVLRTYAGKLSNLITHSGGTALTEYNWSFKTVEGTWSSAAKVDSDAFFPASDPHIARGGDGEAMAAWIIVEGGGTNYNVYGKKYAAGAWGLTDDLIFTSTYLISDLRVAMDNDGNAMAVWSLAQPGARTRLRAKYYNGTSWGAVQNVDAINGVATDSQVVFDTMGNAIVVWKQDNDIVANRYNVQLVTPAWDGVQSLEGGAGAVSAPQLAVIGNGNAIAVWAQTNGYDMVYSNYYTANVGWDITEQSVGNSEAGSVPQVAVDADGNAIAVWLQGTTPPHSVWAAHFDGLLRTWGSLTSLESDAHISTVPQIGVDKQGNATALWRQAPTAGVDRLRYKSFDGSIWGPAGYVDNGVADSSNPKLVVDSEGNAVVAWRQKAVDNVMTVSSAWGNRYRFGTGWVGPQLLETDETYAVGDLTLDLAIDTNGNAAAVWIQSDDIEMLNSVWATTFE